MINEFRKSIQSVMYERISSPFSGAFFLSWCVWNWKLFYYLFFSDEQVLLRMEFVQNNYINLNNNLFFPLLSTIFLVTIFPFITTGSYWIWLKFKNWQNEIRNEIEKKQLLSLEKSIELRLQIRNQEEKFDSILKKKDEEILLLQKEINLVNNKKSENTTPMGNRLPDNYDEEYKKFLKSDYKKYFHTLINTISGSISLTDKEIPYRVKAYFESNDIIEVDQGYLYKFTSKGKYFVKNFLNNNEQN